MCMVKVGVGMVILSLVGLQIVCGVNIVVVCVWFVQDYMCVIIEFDVVFKVMYQFIKDLDCLMVDIDGLDLNLMLCELVVKIVLNDLYICQVCVGQNWLSVVCLVFDLKESVNLQVFMLLLIVGYCNWFVFDLYLINLFDLLMQFVQVIEGKQECFVVFGGMLMLELLDDDDLIVVLVCCSSGGSLIKLLIEELYFLVFVSCMLLCKVLFVMFMNFLLMFVNVLNMLLLEIIFE